MASVGKDDSWTSSLKSLLIIGLILASFVFVIMLIIYLIMGMYNKKGLADTSASSSSTEIGKLCRLTQTDGRCSEGYVLDVTPQEKTGVDSRKTRLGRKTTHSRSAKRNASNNQKEQQQQQNGHTRRRNVTRKRVKVVPITKRHQYSRTRTVTSVIRS